MRRRIMIAVAACAASVAAWASPSEKCFDASAVELDPGAPTTRDTFTVRASGTWGNGCAPAVEGWSREGQEIVVTLTPIPVDGGCITVLTPYDLEVELGQLPAGPYRIAFEREGEAFCGLEPIAFEVAPAAVERAGNPPGATLLIPRFEVDLSTSSGPSTLVAVGNADDEPVLARVVLWTDWGVPTFGFDLALAAGEVRTWDLRHVLGGDLPPISSGDPIAGCGTLGPLGQPFLDVLEAQHTGQPFPGDGLCYGSDRAGSQTAVGYLTIDAVNACSATGANPTTAGYFAPGGTGLASNRNVLWGDYFYLDDAGSSAQGLAAVPLVADAGIEGETFYSRYLGSTADGRAPLGSTYRARYLAGGTFDGGTDLLLWLADNGLPPTPSECGGRGGSIDPCQNLIFRTFEMKGEPTGVVFRQVTELSIRLTVGGPELPVSAPAGWVEATNLTVESCQLLPIGSIPLQLWVTPILTASGRFSVGLEATRIE